MSFAIPSIQSTDLTAAAISTQVWSDKEVIAAYKHHYENESDIEITTFTQNVYKEIISLTDCNLIAIAILQVCDEADNRPYHFKFVIDGETYENTADDPAADGNWRHPFIVGDFEAGITCTISNTKGMPSLLTHDTSFDTSRSYILGLEGHSVSFHVKFVSVAPGTNQKVQARILYTKKELT